MASILHAHQWDTADTQKYIALGPARDEICLYESPLSDNSVVKRFGRGDFESIQSFAYSSVEPGLVGIGQSSGSISLFNIEHQDFPLVTLKPKQARPCNSVSFSKNGLLAAGLDKVRNDNCLLIWDEDQYLSHSDSTDPSDPAKAPLHGYIPNEVISSVAFLPNSPNNLLCGSYKFLRELDVRTNIHSFQCPAKYTHNICVNPTNDTYFSSCSEDGSLAIWDRRYMKAGQSASEPALFMARLFSEPAQRKGSTYTPAFRFSSVRWDEFTVLHDGDLIRRWQMGIVPGSTRNASWAARSSSQETLDNNTDSRHSYFSKNDTLFISSVLDSKTDLDRVAGFDYASDPSNKYHVSFMCIRHSGQVFKMHVLESPDSVQFDPYNDLAILEPERCTIWESSASSSNTTNRKPSNAEVELPDQLANTSIAPTTPTTQRSKRHFSVHSDESILEPDEDDEIGNHTEELSAESAISVLENDISVSIRRRALAGYSTDCETNVEILSMDSSQNTANINYLKSAWRWLSLAYKSESKGTMQCNGLDLGFEGVASIWEGAKGLQGQARYQTKTVTDKDFTAAVSRIINGKKKIFTSSAVRGGPKEVQRQLCLRVAGWNFELSSLEEKLVELEKSGKHEKAAGWAVFHGDVARAVTSLAGSRKERLRLMSTAVAGYLAYKDSDGNSPWREQCRKLASELENAYLRAIFAYIADGSWLDVLDEISLPLVERLGIALRFLSDNDLTVYLNQLTERAMNRGDLEGIVLTGLTPKVVPLLQSYVNKTSDVQTASLLVSFGCPRYFKDSRADCWVVSYCHLLNSWKMFSQRAKLNVARTRLSKRSTGEITTDPVPKQVFLRCSHCKKVMEGPSANPKHGGTIPFTALRQRLKPDFADAANRCENCRGPLPRCAICLLPMGTLSATNPAESKAVQLTAQFDKWPVFCFSCNHGYHAGHADEWFARYDMCPVPECHCLCNSS